MICAFIGHKDAPDSVLVSLREEVKKLIEKGVSTFYVGNHGKFDSTVLAVLKELSGEYSFEYYVVLAYHPKAGEIGDFEHTVLPDGIENVPLRFAVSFRNKWMMDQADYIVSFVKHSWGGAAQFKEYAIKHNKDVIELSDY